MNKINREFDDSKFEMIKQRSIDNVLESVKEKRRFFIPRKSLSLVLMIFLVVLTVPFALKLNDGNGDISANLDSELISTLAYVSSAMLNDEIVLANSTSIMFLADGDDPLVESELDDINIYFDKLKYFVDYTVPFEDILLTEHLLNDYLYTITFTLDDVVYTMNFNIEDDILTGEMLFSDKTFDLAGTYINNDTEQTFEIEAISGLDSMKVSVNTENTTEETKLKLQIQSKIANQVKEKTIEIKDENDEQIVVITEGDSEFKLKKEVTAEYTYKFEYKIGTTEGVLEIEETVDDQGNSEYNYTIKENGNEKVVTKPEPSSNTNGNSNPGNNS